MYKILIFVMGLCFISSAAQSAGIFDIQGQINLAQQNAITQGNLITGMFASFNYIKNNYEDNKDYFKDNYTYQNDYSELNNSLSKMGRSSLPTKNSYIFDKLAKDYPGTNIAAEGTGPDYKYYYQPDPNTKKYIDISKYEVEYYKLSALAKGKTDEDSKISNQKTLAAGRGTYYDNKNQTYADTKNVCSDYSKSILERKTRIADIIKRLGSNNRMTSESGRNDLDLELLETQMEMESLIVKSLEIQNNMYLSALNAQTVITNTNDQYTSGFSNISTNNTKTHTTVVPSDGKPHLVIWQTK